MPRVLPSIKSSVGPGRDVSFSGEGDRYLNVRTPIMRRLQTLVMAALGDRGAAERAKSANYTLDTVSHPIYKEQVDAARRRLKLPPAPSPTKAPTIGPLKIDAITGPPVRRHTSESDKEASAMNDKLAKILGTLKHSAMLEPIVDATPPDVETPPADDISDEGIPAGDSNISSELPTVKKGEGMQAKESMLDPTNPDDDSKIKHEASADKPKWMQTLGAFKTEVVPKSAGVLAAEGKGALIGLPLGALVGLIKSRKETDVKKKLKSMGLHSLIGSLVGAAAGPAVEVAPKVSDAVDAMM